MHGVHGMFAHPSTMSSLATLCWLLFRFAAGRWKATPVAVKIIEHYSSAEGVGSSRGNRVSAGREMLFATSISHPNLVSTHMVVVYTLVLHCHAGWQLRHMQPVLVQACTYAHTDL